jgi:MoaA/NifB/PqqE/SkfB family radical SAM enzyme
MNTTRKQKIRDITYNVSSENVFFVSSSGHCSLDCSYCIIQPIVKHQPCLDFNDIRWLVDQSGGKTALLFSGSGDFFAGYHKKDRLLENVLGLDVEVALDINGAMIHEFQEISESHLMKIKYLNLTLHYAALKEKRALEAWRKNALIILSKYHHGFRMVGFIVSPPEKSSWEDALSFYEKEVFFITGQKIVLIRDVHQAFTADADQELVRISDKFSFMIEEIHQEDFVAKFSLYPNVICSAGKHYFHVWHDGRIEGCGFVEQRRDCGHVKQRRFQPKDDWFSCTTARYCDCSAVAITGKMRYPAL